MIYIILFFLVFAAFLIREIVRGMDDEELAEFLIDLADDGNLRIREWLKQPAE